MGLSAIPELDTVNIVVPTPLPKNKDPDTSHIMAAAGKVAR
jgi:UDP-N-acetyl-D-mannosaminuronate dehydrogenase